MSRLALALLLCIACARTPHEAPPKLTSLCEVVENPAHYYGKRMTVRGCITTDGYHYTNLTSPLCRYRGIGVGDSPASLTINVDTQTCGTFTGVFTPPSEFMGLEIRAALNIEHAKDVKILKEPPYWNPPKARDTATPAP